MDPWDGEKFYCNATSVINFCGLAENNFYKSLKNNSLESRIAFRRFQSDGHFMAKFEVGCVDFFDNLVLNESDSETNRNNLFNHIRKYLECQIKIKIGNKLSEFITFAESSEHLKNAYFWSTVIGLEKKSFNPKDLKYQIEGLDPVLIVHLNKTQFPISKIGLRKVNLNGITDNQFELYHSQIPYKVKNDYKNIDVWFIGATERSVSTPVNKLNFSAFPQEIREIRKNLLKVPIDSKILRKLNSKLQNSQDEIQASRDIDEAWLGTWAKSVPDMLIQDASLISNDKY